MVVTTELFSIDMENTAFASSNLGSCKGGEEIQQMLVLGSGVIGVFATIFLFYTNSFLMTASFRAEVSLRYFHCAKAQSDLPHEAGAARSEESVQK